MQENYKRLVEDFSRRALEKYGDEIDQIVLFGSVARGEAKINSDIDLLIIGNEDRFVLRKKLIDVMYPLMLKYGIYISIKTFTPKDFVSLIDSPFIKNIMEEGVVVYGSGKIALKKGGKEVRFSKTFA